MKATNDIARNDKARDGGARKAAAAARGALAAAAVGAAALALFLALPRVGGSPASAAAPQATPASDGLIAAQQADAAVTAPPWITGIIAVESTAAPQGATAQSVAAQTSSAQAAATTSGSYREHDGVVQLSLTDVVSRIRSENEEYAVYARKVDIYKRKLANSEHDKFLAENENEPLAQFPRERLNYERRLAIDWQYATLDLETQNNALQEKYDSIKSNLKNQYTTLQNLHKSVETYTDELAKLENDISKLQAQINVGLAKESDMISYDNQKIKLQAEMEAQNRQIALAERNLKNDLKIDQAKGIALSPYEETYARFNDLNVAAEIAASAKSCFAVTNGVKKLRLLQADRALMIKYDLNGEFLKDLQENEIAIQEQEYANYAAQKQEESGLWSDYYALLNQEDQITVENLNVKLAQNDYDLAAAKLAQGMASSIEAQNALLTLENAKIAQQTAINKYMRLAEDFAARLA